LIEDGNPSCGIGAHIGGIWEVSFVDAVDVIHVVLVLKMPVHTIC